MKPATNKTKTNMKLSHLEKQTLAWLVFLLAICLTIMANAAFKMNAAGGVKAAVNELWNSNINAVPNTDAKH